VVIPLGECLEHDQVVSCRIITLYKLTVSISNHEIKNKTKPWQEKSFRMFFPRLSEFSKDRQLLLMMKALFPANLMQGDKDHPKLTPISLLTFLKWLRFKISRLAA
jgi:hypothetical protein